HLTVDDVHGTHASGHGIQRTLYLGQHAAGDGAVVDQGLHLIRFQAGEQPALVVEHAGGVGQQHELFRIQHRSHFPGHQIGIDVVAAPVRADADGRDDGDEVIQLQAAHDGRVDVGHFAGHAEIDMTAVVVIGQLQLTRADQAAVLAGQAHGAPAVLVDAVDDFLVDGTAEHHF